MKKLIIMSLLVLGLGTSAQADELCNVSVDKYETLITQLEATLATTHIDHYDYNKLIDTYGEAAQALVQICPASKGDYIVALYKRVATDLITAYSAGVN